MNLYNSREAFTLSELLLALIVIGAISTLVIPNLIEGINRRILVSQLKNTIVSVQQLIDDSLADSKSQNLADTQFASANGLNSFEIAKNCMEGSTSGCWADSYKNANSSSVEKPDFSSIIIKNGVSMAYKVNPDSGDKSCYGLFWIDLNGSDKPNIVGRDLFTFYVTKKGKLVDSYKCEELKTAEAGESSTESEEESWETLKEKFLNDCKNGTTADKISACLSLVQINNWTMDY